MRNKIRNQKGFTLLETMIAIAIMLVSFTAILLTQSSTVENSFRTRNMNTASMLAKNTMIEAEAEVQGKSFTEIAKEKAGQFPTPHDQFAWKRRIKEVKFPKLIQGSSGGGEENKKSQTEEQFGLLLSKYLSDAVREIEVEISWTQGKGKQTYTLSTYWVDFDAKFQMSL